MGKSNGNLLTTYTNGSHFFRHS